MLDAGDTEMSSQGLLSGGVEVGGQQARVQRSTRKVHGKLLRRAKSMPV